MEKDQNQLFKFSIWSLLPSTDVHVRIFWRSYYDTSWEFTREIEEEKLEF